MARRKSGTKATAAGVPRPAAAAVEPPVFDGGMVRLRLTTASWVLLLLAFGTALLTDSPGWFGIQRPFFRGGPYLLQAYAAQFLVMASLACFAAALWYRRNPLRWHPALALVLALLGWTMLSTALSPSPASATIGLSINSQGLLLRIVGTTWLLLSVDLVDRTARIRAAARAIAIAGGVTAAIGLMQVAGINPLGTAGAWGSGRAFGTLGNPDMFGDFIVFALFVSLGVALSEKKLPWRIAMISANALCAASSVTSYSRAAWVGLAVGTVLFLFLTWRSLLEFDRRLAMAMVSVLLVVVAFMAVRYTKPTADVNLAHRVSTGLSLSDPDVAARLEAWSTALRAFAQRPLTGYGPDTMVLASGPLRTARFSAMVDPVVVMESAHNVPIQYLSDLGLPGFVLATAVMFAIASVSYRKICGRAVNGKQLRLVMAGLWTGVLACIADALFTPLSVASYLYFFAALGLLLAPSATGHAFESQASRRALALLLGAIAVAGMVIAVRFIPADLQAAISDDGRLTVTRRIEASAEATRLNPLSVDYATLHAWALMDEAEVQGRSRSDPAAARSFIQEAIVEAQRAVALEPTNPRRYAFLGRVYRTGARFVDGTLQTQAIAAYQEAVRMSPNDLQVRYEYAQALDRDRAIPMLEAIIKVHPTFTEAVIDLSSLYLQAGDQAKARVVLRDALAAPGLTPEQRARLVPALSVIP